VKQVRQGARLVIMEVYEVKTEVQRLRKMGCAEIKNGGCAEIKMGCTKIKKRGCPE